MAGVYYVQATVKRLLDIEAADTADDTLLDDFGAVADQHLDNVLKIYDEKIPRLTTNILNDIKMAAAFYVANLYKGRQGEIELANHWEKMYDTTLEGIKKELEVDGGPYIVERFNSRFAEQAHEFALWD